MRPTINLQPAFRTSTNLLWRSLILFVLALTTVDAIAQSYKPELDGKFLPAQIIFGDGMVRNIQMQYQQPEFFKNPQNKFKLANADGTGAYDHSGGIEAFSIDNNVWVLREVKGQQQFVIIREQGIIEQIEFIINGKVGNVNTGAYLIVGERSKILWHNKKKNEIVEGQLSLEKLKEWIGDAPDVVEDLKNEEQAVQRQNANGSDTKRGLMGAMQKAAAKEKELKYGPDGVDVNRIVHNYNVSFESRTPNTLKYYFSPSMTWIGRTKSSAEVKEERQAKLESLFANRSAVVSPDIASAADNIPVKKESFTAKIKRITDQGNKVGVMINLKAVRTPQQETGAVQLTSQVYVADEFMDESLKEAAKQFADELNKAYGTTAFEVIDINTIPYREVRIMGQTTRVDDFWATKYKVVFAYTLDPRLEATEGSQHSVLLNVLQSLVATEYIGNVTSTKQDILTQILNMGGFRTPAYSQDSRMNEVKEMYEKALTKLDVTLLEKIKAERADGISKVVKRLSP